MCVILLCTVLCGCQNNKETSAANSSATSETAKANIVDKDFSNQIHEKWNSSIADNQPEFLNLLDEKSSIQMHKHRRNRRRILCCKCKCIITGHQQKP